MEYLYWDIETIPAQSSDTRKWLVESVKAPGNLKDPEKIKAAIADRQADAVGKSSFDGFTGHVCTIAWDGPDGEGVAHASSIDQERGVIEAFFRLLKPFGKMVLTGHNIIGFDMPFLTRRAVALGINLPGSFQWPRNLQPWSDKVHDTMAMGAGRDSVSLDHLCKSLGIPGKNGFDGSQVAQAWLDGQHERIAEYCQDCVRRTRAVHERFLAVGY